MKFTELLVTVDALTLAEDPDRDEGDASRKRRYLGRPARAIRDDAAFMTYNQSTQGHLNADGLCFVERHYPSPK